MHHHKGAGSPSRAKPSAERSRSLEPSPVDDVSCFLPLMFARQGLQAEPAIPAPSALLRCSSSFLFISIYLSRCLRSISVKRTLCQRSDARQSTAKTSFKHSFSDRKRGMTLALLRSSKKLRSTRLVVRMCLRCTEGSLRWAREAFKVLSEALHGGGGLGREPLHCGLGRHLPGLA